ATGVGLAGGGRVLDDLTGEDVDAVLLAFARKPDGRRAAGAGGGGQSASSQARFRRSVSALFKHAVLAGWVQIDPMSVATIRARERGGLRPERRALTREQAQGAGGGARGLGGGRPAGGAGDAGAGLACARVRVRVAKVGEA